VVAAGFRRGRPRAARPRGRQALAVPDARRRLIFVVGPTQWTASYAALTARNLTSYSRRSPISSSPLARRLPEERRTERSERSETMNRFTYSGCLLAVAFGASGAAFAQQACERDVQQLERELETRSLDEVTQRQVRQLLSTARTATDQDCGQIVAQVREQLSAGQGQQGQQLAQAQPGQAQQPTQAQQQQQELSRQLQQPQPSPQARSSEQQQSSTQQPSEQQSQQPSSQEQNIALRSEEHTSELQSRENLV